jgi:Arc/MetJ-type ribon-helix-helix transcriptional regulator
MRAMEKITVRLPEQQIRMLNILVACGEFPSVSEAVRDAVRELIERREDKIMEKIKILSEMS